VIPAQAAMLPLFLLLKALGLVNSYGGVIVPAMAGVFGIFLVRQYRAHHPDELLDAARIEGAGEGRIFCEHRAAAAAADPGHARDLQLFWAAGTISMWPLIVLADSDLQTLPVALAALSREHVQDSELMMAGAVLTVLPALAIFLALQRHYLQGLLLGSVKG